MAVTFLNSKGRFQVTHVRDGSLHFDFPSSRYCRTGFRTSRSSTTEPSRRRTSMIDRKSTRLNSSHSQISYAVFCLKKKNKHTEHKNHLLPDSGLSAHHLF